jgi:hypothetical protein
MKLRIESGWPEYPKIFEKKYENSIKSLEQLAKLFEYTFMCKTELINRSKKETNIVKKDIISAQIKDIDEILNTHQDLAIFLHWEAMDTL